MAQPKKYSENFSALRVAEVTMSLNSGRRLIVPEKQKARVSNESSFFETSRERRVNLLLSSPKSTSVLIDLS